MKNWKFLIAVAAVFVRSPAQAGAQSDDEGLREAEARESEMDRKLMEAEAPHGRGSAPDCRDNE